jgi:hypothetical protein
MAGDGRPQPVLRKVAVSLCGWRVLVYTLVKKDRPPPCTTRHGRAEVLAVCCRDWRRASFTMDFWPDGSFSSLFCARWLARLLNASASAKLLNTATNLAALGLLPEGLMSGGTLH